MKSEWLRDSYSKSLLPGLKCMASFWKWKILFFNIIIIFYN